jgi:hypothetical protein
MDGCKQGKTGVSDRGKLAVGIVWQVASAALAAANIATSAHMAAKQFDLARRYYQISRNWRDWYNEAFVPLEDMELDEVTGLKKAEPHYDMAVGRAQVLARIGLAGQPRAALRCLPAHAVGLRTTIAVEASKALGAALASTGQLGWRNERARVAARDDLRWKRLEAVVTRGRSMASENVVYGNLAAGIYGNLAKQAGDAAGGYMRFLAYARNRFEGYFPWVRNRVTHAEDYALGWLRRRSGVPGHRAGQLYSGDMGYKKHDRDPYGSVLIGEFE